MRRAPRQKRAARNGQFVMLARAVKAPAGIRVVSREHDNFHRALNRVSLVQLEQPPDKRKCGPFRKRFVEPLHLISAVSFQPSFVIDPLRLAYVKHRAAGDGDDDFLLNGEGHTSAPLILKPLQSRIDWLALKCENAKYALVNAA